MLRICLIRKFGKLCRNSVLSFPAPTGRAWIGIEATLPSSLTPDTERLLIGTDSGAIRWLWLGLAAAAACLRKFIVRGMAACHAQMYTMGTLLRHGSVEQKEHFSKIFWRASPAGLRRPSQPVEPTRRESLPRAAQAITMWRQGKIWTSRAEHSDLLVLLVRTQKRDEAARPSKGSACCWSICEMSW